MLQNFSILNEKGEETMNERELLQMANRPGKYAEIEQLTNSLNEFTKCTSSKKKKKIPLSFKIFDMIAFFCAIVLLYLVGLFVL